MDLELAIKDQSFFGSGDVIVDLADGEMVLHSDIICQRCPFFEGLFRGRAGGQWLAGRRTEEPSLVRIDLTHVETHLFELVIRHLYTDAGEELFEDVTSEDLNDLLALDELLDHVMDVMSVANELMLDRLSQICQRLIGRYVNARNVCSLLTAVAPSSVAEFKDAALEYVCLSLEAVMQNGSLDELDEDLLLELNQVAHDNQLAYLPFARSGRAEALLFDRYPELAERIERGKRAKVDAIVLSNKYADADSFSTSFRAQSLEEVSASPLRQRNRRRASKDTKSPASTPALKGKNSVQDLMFDMSDGDDNESSTPKKINPPRFTESSNDQMTTETPTASPEIPWATVRRQSRSSPHSLDRGEDIPLKSVSPLPPPLIQETRTAGQPWGSAPLAGAKLDLKDIMAQASTATPSNLTIGLSRGENERVAKAAHAKLSQKERKRLQQAQQLGTPIEKTQPAPPTVSPWQATSHRKPSNSPSVAPVSQPSPKSSPQPSRTSSTPQLTMRQTVANNGIAAKHKEKEVQAQNHRTTSASTPSQPRLAASERGMSVSTDPIPTPRSVRHIPLPSHSLTSPSQNLSMMEILSLQEAEKTSIRDAAAKRSLQEIQQEQEFQQWWDQESRRVLEEEEQQKRAAERAARNAAARGRGRGRGGRGGKGKTKDKKDDEPDDDRGKGSRAVSAGPTQQDNPPKIPKHDGGGKLRGHDGSDRGRGRGRIGRGGSGSARGGRANGPQRNAAAAPGPPMSSPAPAP